jgi:hypothetical protein
MSKRSVKPEIVKTLGDWSARWSRYGNVGFDPETREPAVFAMGVERKQVSKIPWKREGDTLTILSQPSRFSAQAVTAATQRYGRIRDEREAVIMEAEGGIQLAEATLMEAWRVYRAADPASRSTFRRDILTAERALRELELDAAPAGRVVRTFTGSIVGVYNPPMPVDRRGIPMTAVAGSEGGEGGEGGGLL